jgi:hypothetical protein
MTKIMLFLVILGHSCTRIIPYMNMHAVLGLRGCPLGLKRKFSFSQCPENHFRLFRGELLAKIYRNCACEEVTKGKTCETKKPFL